MKKTPYLIAYDIADNRIRTKVYKRLCAEAIPVQASVFIMDYKEVVKRLMDELADITFNDDKLLCVTLYSAGFTRSSMPNWAFYNVEYDDAFLNVLMNGTSA